MIKTFQPTQVDVARNWLLSGLASLGGRYQVVRLLVAIIAKLTN